MILLLVCLDFRLYISKTLHNYLYLISVFFQVFFYNNSMRTLLLILILSLSVYQEVVADFFKWEILFAEKGFGTEFKTIPIVAEGKIEFTDP